MYITNYPKSADRSRIEFDDVLPEDVRVGHKVIGHDADGPIVVDQYDIDTNRADEISTELNKMIDQALEGTGVSGSFRAKTWDYDSSLDHIDAHFVFFIDPSTVVTGTEVPFRLHDLLLRFVPPQSMVFLEGEFVRFPIISEDPPMERHPDGTVTRCLVPSDDEEEPPSE